MKDNSTVKMTKRKASNKFLNFLVGTDEPTAMPESSFGIDKPLLLFILLLLLTGSVMVFSASRAYAETHFGDPNYFIRLQSIWAVVGVIVMLLASCVPPSTYKKLTGLGYAVTAVLLLLVLILGFTAGGAQRWIGIGPFTFQPSELAKTMLILMLAKYFTTRTRCFFIPKKALRFSTALYILLSFSFFTPSLSCCKSISPVSLSSLP